LEIELAEQGKPAEVWLKLNNLSDVETVNLIVNAAEKGVKFKLIVRSMFSLVISPSQKNIQAISIVDRYLEHSRMLVFGNNGFPKVYLSSADFLPRNFDSRIETVFPILDKNLSEQLIRYFEIQWSGNVKSRVLDAKLTNKFKQKKKDKNTIRAQYEIAEYLKSL